MEKRERQRRQSLDGDGSWRQTTGERRKHDRRSDDADKSAMIDLPFLDELWDANSETEKKVSDPVRDNDENDHSARTPNPQTTVNIKIEDDSSSSNLPSSESDAMSDSEKRKPLSFEEKARLNSLKTMLDASNARYQQASRNRGPVFAAGLEVKVIKGEHVGKLGVVLDADYIESRALISLPDQESPLWMDFKSLGHTD